MTEERKTKIQIALLFTSMVISCVVISYFWFIHLDFTAKINVWIMILAVVYIAIEMAKRNLVKIHYKWSRIYYIGLLAVIAPIALENKTEAENIRLITNIGVVFLLVPLLIEAKTLFKAKQT